MSPVINDYRRNVVKVTCLIMKSPFEYLPFFGLSWNTYQDRSYLTPCPTVDTAIYKYIQNACLLLLTYKINVISFYILCIMAYPIAAPTPEINGRQQKPVDMSFQYPMSEWCAHRRGHCFTDNKIAVIVKIPRVVYIED